MSDEWFYKTSGEEVGPVPFERLREFASTNRLSPHDHVRSADSIEWIEARRFSHLFENPQADAPDPPAEETNEINIDDFQIVNEEPDSPLASLEELGIQVSDEPAGPLPEKRNAADLRDSEDQWICRVLGVQLGPMPSGDMRLLARNGEISLDDDVRRIDETHWRPAKSVEGLFPGFDFHSDDELPVTEARAIAESPNLPQLGDDIDQALAGLSSVEIPQAPEPPPSVSQESKAEKPAETSVASANDSADRAAQLRAEYESRAAQAATFTAPPRVSTAKPPKSSGSGSGIQFSDLFDKIKDNPKVLGVLAVLALVLLIKYVPWSSEPSDQSYLDQITHFTNRYKELRAQKASPAEVEQFKKDALAVIVRLKDELDKRGAGIKDRPKQEMLWACMMLKEVISRGLSEEPTDSEKTLDRHIASARALIQGTPPLAENRKDELPAESAIQE